MCFSQEMSGAFAACGLLMSIWTYYTSRNIQLAIGIFYFFLMEFLQYFQYMFIDDCDNKWNRILTLVGYAHICFQPYFTHLLNSALTMSRTVMYSYMPVLRLCLIGGVMLFARALLADSRIFSVAEDSPCGPSTEWLRGETLCTFKGRYHLAWSVPLAEVSYNFSPSVALHSFLMFMPFVAIKLDMIPQGLFLWLTGPFLASLITPNLMEQASIWCFFSICQIFIMIFVIRRLIGGKSDEELRKAPYMDMRFAWPLKIVEPAASSASKKKKN